MTTTLSKSRPTLDRISKAYSYSPFSQKNIQECRCGTESCRGVLGPKPKKPIEEKSVTSVLIAGTKRKVQSLFGASRAGSESTPTSPKKRKVCIGDSVTAKTKNAIMESQAARERAEKEANEHWRQIASRENRAIKRSITGTGSRRARSNFVRSHKSSSVKFTRHTTVSFKHNLPKPGTLKAVKKPTVLHSARARNTSALRTQKDPQASKRLSTPIQCSNAEGSHSEEETSPNITPASLRSASAKSSQLSPVNRKQMGRKESSGPGLERDRAVGALALGIPKLRHRDSSSAPRSIHKAGAGVKKLYHPAQSRSRSTRGM